MKLIGSLLVLGCSLAFFPEAKGQQFVYDFTTNLSSFGSQNGKWEWADVDRMPWWLPDGGDGFAVLYLPGEGDALYETQVDIQPGVEYEIRFFIASETAGTTSLQIQQLDSTGAVIQTIEDFQDLSDPSNAEWITRTGSIPASDAPSNFAVFCSTNGINSLGGTFYGCAVDYIVLDVTEPETTPAPTTTTTTTTTTTETTTSGPTEFVDWTFADDTDGWTLGNSNGAAWRRYELLFSNPNIQPPTGNSVIHVWNTDVYSGTVLAMSPRLITGDSGVVSVTVEFFISVSDPNYPAYLKLRRRLSYTTYDENVAINLDPYGDQVNQQWLTVTETFEGLTPGEEFNVVLEGNLGIADGQNQIYVSRVYMEGVSEVPYNEESIFDFADGLVGWQAGSMDGGKWEVVRYDDLDPDIGMPAPLTENILVVNRFDIHSGVITIESPPIQMVPSGGKQLNMRLWMRGSQVYPVKFRIGLKSMDGFYDDTPFYNLAQYGDANLQYWLDLGSYVEIPADPRESFFQLVFEVDLGSDADNQIAIDLFVIRTVGV